MASNTNSSNNQSALNEAVRLLSRAVELLGGPPDDSGPGLHDHSTITRPTVSSGSMTPSVQTNNTNSIRPTREQNIVSEQRRLFRRAPITQSRRHHPFPRTARNNVRQWTKEFMCLPTTDSNEVPTLAMQCTLQANGIGRKKLRFHTTANASEVRETIYSAYPKLRECGGIDFLRTKESSRTKLVVIATGSISAEDMRTLSTGKLYVRPIQKNIMLDPLAKLECVLEERCQVCGENIPANLLHEHLDQCGPSTSSNESTDLDTVEDIITVDDVETDENLTIAENTIDSENDTELLEINNADISRSDNIGVLEAVRKALELTTENEDPVEMIRKYQKCLMRGRDLDLISESETIEGETYPIFISRNNIFSDGLEELLRPNSNFSVPLEVDFLGEKAADLGGPRREFLTIMLRSCKEQVFNESGDLHQNENLLANRHYYGTGLVMGLCIMQNGPTPAFLGERTITAILGNIQPTEYETQLIDGLNHLGLVDIVRARRSVAYLFRSTAVSQLTFRKITKLLAPSFSEEGGNNRLYEEQAYKKFTTYVREVAAGRRDGIDLSRILKFCTGLNDEPLLGFACAPTLEFRRMSEGGSWFPTSNTCINRITLTTGNLPDDAELFAAFDMAFLCDHFGQE